MAGTRRVDRHADLHAKTVANGSTSSKAPARIARCPDIGAGAQAAAPLDCPAGEANNQSQASTDATWRTPPRSGRRAATHRIGKRCQRQPNHRDRRRKAPPRRLRARSQRASDRYQRAHQRRPLRAACRPCLRQPAPAPSASRTASVAAPPLPIGRSQRTTPRPRLERFAPSVSEPSSPRTRAPRKGARQASKRRLDAVGLIAGSEDMKYRGTHGRSQTAAIVPDRHPDRSPRRFRMAEVEAHITGTVWKIECAWEIRSRRATLSRSSSR